MSDLDLQKYSGSRFLFSKRSAVNPFEREFSVLFCFSSFARFSERCIPQNQNQGNGYLKTSLAKAGH